jgi:hypothetical protein
VNGSTASSLSKSSMVMNCCSNVMTKWMRLGQMCEISSSVVISESQLTSKRSSAVCTPTFLMSHVGRVATSPPGSNRSNTCFQKGCNEKWVLVHHFRVRGMQDNLMLQA